MTQSFFVLVVFFGLFGGESTYVHGSDQPLIWPVDGFITSRYGYRGSEPYRHFHKGLDIAERLGTPIYAAAAGEVIEVIRRDDVALGHHFRIRHAGGMQTVYAHCRRVLVEVGQRVLQGDIVAELGSTGTGSTGPHLHFEVWVQGRHRDPERFLPDVRFHGQQMDSFL